MSKNLDTFCDAWNELILEEQEFVRRKLLKEEVSTNRQ